MERESLLRSDKDLVMTQHRLAQVYQMKARSSEEEKELERRMSVLRKSLPDKVKVNRVISRNNQRCNGEVSRMR